MSSTIGFSINGPRSDKTSVRNRTTTIASSDVATAIQGKVNQEIVMSDTNANQGNEVSAAEIGRTGQVPQGQDGPVQQNEPQETDFLVTTEPPKFVSGQGRGKSPVRIAIERLEPGQYLKVGPVSDKLKNSTRAMAASVQTEAKTRGVEISFLIREDEQGNLWVGRRAPQSDM